MTLFIKKPCTAVLLIIFWSLTVFTRKASTTDKPDKPYAQRRYLAKNEMSNFTKADDILRVMTFNILHEFEGIDDGFEKFKYHIANVNPDILLIQESSASFSKSVMTHPIWLRPCYPYKMGDAQVLTRFEILKPEPQAIVPKHSVGCRLKVVSKDKKWTELSVWSLHLHWRDYGPTKLCWHCKVKEKNSEDLDKCVQEKVPDHKCPGCNIADECGRVQQIDCLSKHRSFSQAWNDANSSSTESDTVPLIVGGDFNAPSHLDWTDEAKDMHCNRSYKWPVSQKMEKMGLKDSYREANKDPSLNPGNTWTTKDYLVYDPVEGYGSHDRVDFIYYKDPSGSLTIDKSWTYCGLDCVHDDTSSATSVKGNSWPSDHAAVVTDFKMKLQKQLNVADADDGNSNKTYSNPKYKAKNEMLNFTRKNGTLRVMTMLVHKELLRNAGERLVAHVEAIDPDIFLLQQLDHSTIRFIRDRFTKLRHCPSQYGANTAIFTRFKDMKEKNKMHDIDEKFLPTYTGCSVQILYGKGRKLPLHVVSTYMSGKKYGPNRVCWSCENQTWDKCSREKIRRNNCDKSKNNEQVLQGEQFCGRYQQLFRLSQHKPLQMNDSFAENYGLTILGASFNSPSHLDWIAKTKHMHCNGTFEWPVSKLMEDLGFKDSYRVAHPDPSIRPGNTWTHLDYYERSYPTHDRTDYIYYKNKSVNVEVENKGGRGYRLTVRLTG